MKNDVHLGSGSEDTCCSICRASSATASDRRVSSLALLAREQRRFDTGAIQKGCDMRQAAAQSKNRSMPVEDSPLPA